jgi:hypothetical protein
MLTLREAWLAGIELQAEALGLAALLDVATPRDGRIWLVPKGTTRPCACLRFAFEPDELRVELRTGDGPPERMRLAFADGCDALLSALERTVSAHRLEVVAA